jgi:hypothetical protein
MHTIFLLENRKEKTFGRPRRKFEDNIRMEVRERGWEGVDWMHLVQDRDQWQVLVNTVMNLQTGNFLTDSVTVSFSRRILLHGVSFFART